MARCTPFLRAPPISRSPSATQPARETRSVRRTETHSSRAGRRVGTAPQVDDRHCISLSIVEAHYLSASIFEPCCWTGPCPPFPSNPSPDHIQVLLNSVPAFTGDSFSPYHVKAMFLPQRERAIKTASHLARPEPSLGFSECIARRSSASNETRHSRAHTHAWHVHPHPRIEASLPFPCMYLSLHTFLTVPLPFSLSPSLTRPVPVHSRRRGLAHRCF